MNLLQVSAIIFVLVFATMLITAEGFNNTTLLVVPTKLFQNCSLHFTIGNSSSINYENLEFPFSILTHSGGITRHEESSFKRHWIFCTILIPILSPFYNLTSNLPEVYNAIKLMETMKHPLMVIVMSKPSNKSSLNLLVSHLGTVKQVLCKILYTSFVEKDVARSQGMHVTSSSETAVTGGACFCPTCYLEYQTEVPFAEFNCSRNQSKCFDDLQNACMTVTDNGTRVSWKFDGTLRFYTEANMTSTQIDASPMNIKNATGVQKSIEMYVFHGMNWTNYPVPPSPSISTPAVAINGLSWDKGSYPVHGEVHRTGRLKSYRFITNSEVHKPKATSGEYLSPLRQGVMHYLITIQILLVILMIKVWKSPRNMTDFVLGFIWVSATLLEQSQQFPVQPKNRKYIRLVFLLWLFLAIVLSNAYKSVVKSELMADAPYDTHLHSFMDISNFSTYVLTTNENCNGTPVQLWNQNQNKSRICHGVTDVVAEFRKACNFLKLLVTAEAHLKKDAERIKDDPHIRNKTGVIHVKENLAKLIQSWKKNIWSVCLPQMNESNMLASLTVPTYSAFIVPDVGHEYFWEIFEEAMRKDHDLKYALGKERSDERFIRSPALITTEILDIWAGSSVSWRMKTLLSSGIYWLWVKWDAIMFPDVPRTKLPKGVPSRTNEPKGLSLRTARVYQAFRWYLTGIALALNRFFYERISCSTRYQVMRLYALAVWEWARARFLQSLKSYVPLLKL